MVEQTLEKRDFSIARKALTLRKFPSENLSLIRRGTNSVFTVDDLIVKVSKREYPLNLLEQQVTLMTWLSNHNFPVARLRSDVLTIDDHRITIWSKIPSLGKPDYIDLGKLVRDFHDLTDEYPGVVPEWNGFSILRERLPLIENDSRLTKQDKTVIKDIFKMNKLELEKHQYVLKPGILHGDINMSNVVNDGNKLWLLDFDRLTIGPREWDLITPMVDTYLFEGKQRLWRDFVKGYGFDLGSLEVTTWLFELRALMAFSWLFTLPESKEVNKEIKNRLKYFYTNEINENFWKTF